MNKLEPNQIAWQQMLEKISQRRRKSQKNIFHSTFQLPSNDHFTPVFRQIPKQSILLAPENRKYSENNYIREMVQTLLNQLRNHPSPRACWTFR